MVSPVGGTFVPYTGGGAVSGPDGGYRVAPLSQNPGNTPRNFTWTVSMDGFWLVRTPVDVSANQDTVVDATLVSQCTGGISGTVVFAGSGSPAAFYPVAATQAIRDAYGVIGNATYSAITDEAGRFSVPAAQRSRSTSAASSLLGGPLSAR